MWVSIPGRNPHSMNTTLPHYFIQIYQRPKIQEVLSKPKLHFLFCPKCTVPACQTINKQCARHLSPEALDSKEDATAINHYNENIKSDDRLAPIAKWGGYMTYICFLSVPVPKCVSSGFNFPFESDENVGHPYSIVVDHSLYP